MTGGFEAALSLLQELWRALTIPPMYGVASWLLSATFLLSGIAKLRHPTLAAMAMVDFGLGRAVHPLFGRLAGIGESLLAAGILTTLTTNVSGGEILFGAAVILWIFVFLIARSLTRGERFPCFCFGDPQSNLSVFTLLRSLALAILASSAASQAMPAPAIPPEDLALDALSAAAILGLYLLGGRIPALLRWNGDLFAPAKAAVD